MVNQKNIEKHLITKPNIIHLGNINSTNEYAKREDIRPNTVIIANSQTAGKGRNGKSFLSRKGGIYMSIVQSAENFDAAKITLKSANAVCNAIEKVCKIDCRIKWVNDVFTDNKKVCGILAESVITPEKGAKIIVGIGINANNRISRRISDIATSLRLVTGKKPDINLLIATVINEFFLQENNDNYLAEYKARSMVIGKEITVIPNGLPAYTAIAEKIACDGGLVISHDGITETLHYGEISIKIKE